MLRYDDRGVGKSTGDFFAATSADFAKDAEAALRRAQNPDATFLVFPRANHLFQEAATGSPNEYARLPKAFVPGFLETIGEWLIGRFG